MEIEINFFFQNAVFNIRDVEMYEMFEITNQQFKFI